MLRHKIPKGRTEKKHDKSGTDGKQPQPQYKHRIPDRNGLVILNVPMGKDQHASTPSAGADFWCEPWSMSASTVAERDPYTKSDYHPVQSASYDKLRM